MPARSTRYASNWARMPNAWLATDGLLFFRGGKERGASMAALKVMLAIMVHAENNPLAKAGDNQGSAALTYTELSVLTGLSRGMVSAGIKKLQEGEFVRVEQEGQGGRNRYFLADYGPRDRYVPLPLDRLWAGGAGSGEMKLLHALSSRRHSDFNALKLYILLCGMRDRRTGAAKISYEGIYRRSRIPEARIRAALSVLYDHRLVRRVEEKSPTPDKRNPPNEYYILGLGVSHSEETDDEASSE